MSDTSKSRTGKPPARKPATKGEVVPAKPTLPQLATTANEAHVRARQAGTEVVENALRAGEALLAAKEQVAHGEWGPWLAKNFKASQDTAENYMRFARNSEHVRNLPLEEASLRGALNSLRALRPANARPREEPKKLGPNPFEEDMTNLSKGWRRAKTAKAKAAAVAVKALEEIEATDPAVLDDGRAFRDRLARQVERFDELVATEVA